MAFRELLARYQIHTVIGRISSRRALTARATVGVVAVVAASWIVMSAPNHTANPQLTSSVTECHDMVTVSVAGRYDTPTAGTTKMLTGAHGEALPAAMAGDYHSHWVDPVVNAPASSVRPGSYAAVYIAYPANLNSYENAVNTGVANAEQVMREIAKACPNTRFSVVGYSEGADVARRVAMDIGHQNGIVKPANVVGVVILADAGRSPGDGPFPGAQNPFGHPDGFNQQYQNGTIPAPGSGVLPGTSGDFGALNGKVASFCHDGDLTCAAPANISLLHLVVNVGRQLNLDALQKDKLTPATGQDVAVTLGRIALAAFADIQSTPNWMQSDETFLQVLLKVSEPGYKPGAAPNAPQAGAIATNDMSPLAYLPKKVLNEIVGLIVTNQNTIPVIMSDPYNLTLGPNASGHHFDYWRDANAADGKPITSAEYAAAWLTHLAQDAQAGKPLDTTAKPKAADLAAAYQAVAATMAAPTTSSTASPTSAADATVGTSTAATPTSITPTTTSTSTSPSGTPSAAATSTAGTPSNASAVAAPTQTTPAVSTTPTTESAASTTTTTTPSQTTAQPR